MDNQDLKQYFKEIDPLEKDLRDAIFQKITQQKSRSFQPVGMPPILLWSIVGLLMFSLAYALFQVEGSAIAWLDLIHMPNFSTFPKYEVAPFVIVIMPILTVIIWLIIFLEKKIMTMMT